MKTYLKTMALGIIVLLPCAIASESASQVASQKVANADNSWIAAQWLPDLSFKKLRGQIETEMNKNTNGREMNSFAERYARQARTKRDDPLAQFSWGVAALRQVQIQRLMTYGSMVPALEGMKRTSQPHSYEYARLRFLLTMATSSGEGLKEVGLRLHQRAPQDLDVSYYLINALDYKSSRERKLAFDLANSFLKNKPKSPSTFFVIGRTNHRAWLATGSKAYGDRAIASYTKHMSMTKVDAIGKRQIATLLNEINSGKR